MSEPVPPTSNGRPMWPVTAAVLLLAAVVAGATVAGPGLSWDEPAYRHSQVTLQNWFKLLWNAESPAERLALFSADAIERFWQYNRFGHNFHPPMAGYGNLLTWCVMRHWWDDISARRLASALQFAGAVALLCHFIGTRYGRLPGLFAALALFTMPRLMGHAHVIGTDMPLMFFWAATAVAFYNGSESRHWQWAAAFLWACLFLVKFSGALIAAPFALWIFGSLCRGARWRQWKRWLAWSALILLPLILPGVTLLFGAKTTGKPSLTRRVAAWGMEHPILPGLLMLWPLVALVAYYRLNRQSLPAHRQNESETAQREWSVLWEFPWVAAAVTPLLCIALNPTWWHNPITSLAAYFDLNLDREGHLPDIGIFYLGKRYLYSLPPMNAYVLMAVTIPAGTLLLGLVGIARTVMAPGYRFGWYLLLQMLTLPGFRMLPTPAHDGVRLFLPTFFFWAGLAAIGALGIVQTFARRKQNLAIPVWLGLFLLGPVIAGIQWVRIHPFELSYYNVGLKTAMDWGFEVTYWYDAVTPDVLEQLNHRLPENVRIGFPDPLINPEVFYQLQELGRLRADINLEADPEKSNQQHSSTADSQARQPETMPWTWLLTHSSKATAYTRLLYACQPWFESGYRGVRLFSVVDGRGGAVAFGLHLLVVDRDRTSKLGPLELNDIVFTATPEQLRTTVRLIVEHREKALQHAPADPVVRQLLNRWIHPDGTLNPSLAMLLERAPWALGHAASLVNNRKDDIRTLLAYPGYLRPDQFGGYFDIPEDDD